MSRPQFFRYHVTGDLLLGAVYGSAWIFPLLVSESGVDFL